MYDRFRFEHEVLILSTKVERRRCSRFRDGRISGEDLLCGLRYKMRMSCIPCCSVMIQFLVWPGRCEKRFFLSLDLSSLKRRVPPSSWSGRVARIRWAMSRLLISLLVLSYAQKRSRRRVCGTSGVLLLHLERTVRGVQIRTLLRCSRG